MTSQHKKLKYFTTKGDTVSRDQNLLAWQENGQWLDGTLSNSGQGT